MPAVLGRVSLRSVRKARVKEVPLSEAKDALSRYLRQAEEQPVVITRHGKPAGILIGFESEDDWFDYRLENDPRFLARVEKARASLRWKLMPKSLSRSTSISRIAASMKPASEECRAAR